MIVKFFNNFHSITKFELNTDKNEKSHKNCHLLPRNRIIPEKLSPLSFEVRRLSLIR